MHVVVMQSIAGDTVINTVYTQDREMTIYIFAALYLVVLCLVGGKQGLKGALGLVFTFLCILFVYLPLVYRGYSLLGGGICVHHHHAGHHVPHRRSHQKDGGGHGGTVAGVVIAGFSATIFSIASGISGWNVSDIESLLTLWNVSGIQVGGLLFSGLLISSLGAVMDVAMSIGSSIERSTPRTPRSPERSCLRRGCMWAGI